MLMSQLHAIANVLGEGKYQDGGGGGGGGGGGAVLPREDINMLNNPRPHAGIVSIRFVIFVR